MFIKTDKCLINITIQSERNVGHFGLGRFSPDISATDVSATENAKGGCFGQIMNFGLGCVHA